MDSRLCVGKARFCQSIESCKAEQQTGEIEMLLTDFDALTFDCYGTLIDWECGDCRRPAMWAASF